MSRLVHLVSSKSPQLNPLLAIPHAASKSIKKYSQHKGVGKEETVSSSERGERAPSTAEVLQQLTDEKERSLDENSGQGVVSHNYADKVISDIDDGNDNPDDINEKCNASQ
ncbi:uncharacterized protein LOC110723898 [Chenopodium quinoa]|uniref:uncharacterized protein LOC110723898 n=1 Tax=Chenopodium quinoa TaxID=63459 RepID=UPI000B7884A5|nr:uncharacterized protein LOC110723898 [Chenopodium quinoa]